MAKRQTRRSVSFRAEVFERMRRHCEMEGISVAGFAEAAVQRRLDLFDAPAVDRQDALEALDARKTENAIERARQAIEDLRAMGIDPHDQRLEF